MSDSRHNGTTPITLACGKRGQQDTETCRLWRTQGYPGICGEVLSLKRKIINEQESDSASSLVSSTPPHTLHPSHLLDEVATVGHLPSRRLSLSPDPLPRAFTVGGLLYVISRNWDAQGPRSGK